MAISFLFTIYKIRLEGVVCELIFSTTGFLKWESGRIVQNSRVENGSSLGSEIVLSSLSSFVI